MNSLNISDCFPGLAAILSLGIQLIDEAQDFIRVVDSAVVLRWIGASVLGLGVRFRRRSLDEMSSILLGDGELALRHLFDPEASLEVWPMSAARTTELEGKKKNIF